MESLASVACSVQTSALLQVLLFSTMTRALDVIEEVLDWSGFHHLRLDGATAAADRGRLVEEFNRPGARSIHLFPFWEWTDN